MLVTDVSYCLKSLNISIKNLQYCDEIDTRSHPYDRQSCDWPRKENYAWWRIVMRKDILRRWLQEIYERRLSGNTQKITNCVIECVLQYSELTWSFHHSCSYYFMNVKNKTLQRILAAPPWCDTYEILF